MISTITFVNKTARKIILPLIVNIATENWSEQIKICNMKEATLALNNRGKRG